ncbi:MAG: hypothetical protein KQ78_01497 [Candidatus Izimaplasma bacterium HR2]|nr:MAG: hypothetical protein KQ78_01497 [Candidatus Izimaplasma bacterium HR2]
MDKKNDKYPRFPYPNGRRYNLTGFKFGMLTAREVDEIRSKGRPYWICDCDCGNTTTVDSRDLLLEKTKSCGCNRYLSQTGSAGSSWSGTGELSGSFISHIIKNAKKRNIKYSITKEYLWELFLEQDRKCALTGVDISIAGYGKKDCNRTGSLDRIDSSKGYIEGNVWWVHKDINFMKNEFSLVKFKNWCKMVVEYRKEF